MKKYDTRPSYHLSPDQYEQMHWWKNEDGTNWGYYVRYLAYTWWGETLDKAKRDIKKNMRDYCEEMLKKPIVSQKTIEKKYRF